MSLCGEFSSEGMSCRQTNALNWFHESELMFVLVQSFYKIRACSHELDFEESWNLPFVLISGIPHLCQGVVKYY